MHGSLLRRFGVFTLIARDDIGMPSYMVREDALGAASVVVAVVAGLSWGRRATLVSQLDAVVDHDGDHDHGARDRCRPD
jgi:hypothetical protein